MSLPAATTSNCATTEGDDSPRGSFMSFGVGLFPLFSIAYGEGLTTGLCDEPARELADKGTLMFVHAHGAAAKYGERQKAQDCPSF
jgi:hypothetical protein